MAENIKDNFNVKRMNCRLFEIRNRSFNEEFAHILNKSEHTYSISLTTKVVTMTAFIGFYLCVDYKLGKFRAIAQVMFEMPLYKMSHFLSLTYE